MLELKEMPKWMEKFIPSMTNESCQTKEDLDVRIANMDSWDVGLITRLNYQMDLLIMLKNKGFLVEPEIRKPITEVKIGEIFKIYPNQERYFVLNSTEEVCGQVTIRELMGGKGFISSWLGEPGSCHSDIEVIVVPRPSKSLLRD